MSDEVQGWEKNTGQSERITDGWLKENKEETDEKKVERKLIRWYERRSERQKDIAREIE